MSAGLPTLRRASVSVFACAALALVSCGGDTVQGTDAGLSQTGTSNVRILKTTPGVTPFISFVDIGGNGPKPASVEFTIAPKSGTVSRPVHVRYPLKQLRVYEHSVPAPAWVLRLPVFGLYAGFLNQVSVLLDFRDGSTMSRSVPIETAPHADPNGIYDHPLILKNRNAGAALGFDFFVIKSGLGTPVIVDTDGEVRWVGAGVDNGQGSAVEGSGFVIGSVVSPTLYRLGFDGALEESKLPDPRYTYFHHNIDYGKQGLLAEVNADDDGVENLETVLVEVTADGSIVNTWDLAAILTTYMQSQGDDASTFVRPGVDWFHMNAATYDPSDDSVIVSSRENFLIKLDYSTGRIVWILGDPTKYWYTFPSLQVKALKVQAGGLYPIGQHAVSITPDGLVMVFNDGLASFNQPPGASAGQSRTYSAVSAYSIDSASGTAQEVWRFDYGQSIYSSFCSSAYEVSGGSVLVNYAVAANDTEARLVGLDEAHDVVFDFQYPTTACNTSWNAIPIALDDFAIM
jgi:arylsulfate sulfotransferase